MNDLETLFARQVQRPTQIVDLKAKVQVLDTFLKTIGNWRIYAGRFNQLHTTVV
jgi:hypothetical protein